MFPLIKNDNQEAIESNINIFGLDRVENSEVKDESYLLTHGMAQKNM